MSRKAGSLITNTSSILDGTSQISNWASDMPALLGVALYCMSWFRSDQHMHQECVMFWFHEQGAHWQYNVKPPATRNPGP